MVFLIFLFKKMLLSLQCSIKNNKLITKKRKEKNMSNLKEIFAAEENKKFTENGDPCI